MTTKHKFFESLSLFLVIICLIAFSVIGLHLSPLVPILVSLAFIIFWARWKKFSWQTIHLGIEEGIQTGIVPILIFILIGALIASWIAAGIIPAMMVVGFKLLRIDFFIPASFVVCAIVGTSIGSAFTTVSTIGLALLGMGVSLGFNPPLVSGAIISGAVFGDKMSPLSDTTNLAAAIAEVDLFSHIKNMMWTTVPAFILSLIAFFLFGRANHPAVTTNTVKELSSVLTTNFSIGWWSFLPILFMVVCSIKKIPAIATLLLNICLSLTLVKITNPKTSLQQLVQMIESGYISKTGSKTIDALLTRGGISSMMGAVSLILVTLALGGLLMKFEIIQHLMAPITKKLTSATRLITATILAGFLANIMIGEQYLSIILPGNAMKPAFKQSNVQSLSLSRALEDAGTVLNCLIPWGVSGTFMANTLGVPTLSYLPFTFFVLLCPILSILSGVTNIGIQYKEEPKPTNSPLVSTGTNQ